MSNGKNGSITNTSRVWMYGFVVVTVVCLSIFIYRYSIEEPLRYPESFIQNLKSHVALIHQNYTSSNESRHNPVLALLYADQALNAWQSLRNLLSEKEIIRLTKIQPHSMQSTLLHRQQEIVQQIMKQINGTRHSDGSNNNTVEVGSDSIVLGTGMDFGDSKHVLPNSFKPKNHKNNDSANMEIPTISMLQQQQQQIFSSPMGYWNQMDDYYEKMYQNEYRKRLKFMTSNIVPQRDLSHHMSHPNSVSRDPDPLWNSLAFDKHNIPFSALPISTETNSTVATSHVTNLDTDAKIPLVEKKTPGIDKGTKKKVKKKENKKKIHSNKRNSPKQIKNTLVEKESETSENEESKEYEDDQTDRSESIYYENKNKKKNKNKNRNKKINEEPNFENNDKNEESTDESQDEASQAAVFKKPYEHQNSETELVQLAQHPNQDFIQQPFEEIPVHMDEQKLATLKKEWSIMLSDSSSSSSVSPDSRFITVINDDSNKANSQKTKYCNLQETEEVSTPMKKQRLHTEPKTISVLSELLILKSFTPKEYDNTIHYTNNANVTSPKIEITSSPAVARTKTTKMTPSLSPIKNDSEMNATLDSETDVHTPSDVALPETHESWLDNESEEDKQDNLLRQMFRHNVNLHD